MSIQVDSTNHICSFCQKSGHPAPLVRSMHGLYCTNENCYSRVIGGNLVPAVPCQFCKENAFYVEEDGTIESSVYICIACGQKTPTD